MSALSLTILRGAGFSLVGRDKAAPEDRWALAELDGFAVGAVADGLSDPLGDGRGGASGAVADEAVGVFVDHASRLFEGGLTDPEALARESFAAAERAARALASATPGGAAFVGACLDAAGTLAVIKVGDCRALVPDARSWQSATPSDDADRRGALTAFLGATEVHAEVVVHRGVDRVVLLSDGGWRAGPPIGTLSEPFPFVRDLVARARRAGESDDLTALALVRSGPRATLLDRLAPLTFALAGALFFVAGLLAASLFQGAP